MWIFIEDRDFETGHGWRDNSACELRTVYDKLFKRDCVDVFEYGNRLYLYPEYSYAWICRAEYFDTRGYMEDDVRTGDVLIDHILFQGSDDMECHFSFKMTPEEMREHLLGLGFEERKFKRKFKSRI